MPSLIDATQPPALNPTTAGVRAQFLTAKTEISQLQIDVGAAASAAAAAQATAGSYNSLNEYPAFRTARPLKSVLLPNTSIAYNALGGGSSGSAAADSSNLCNGRASTKFTLTTTAASLNYINVGTAAGAVTLDTVGQALLTNQQIFFAKTDGANTLTGLIVYVKDGANQYYFNLAPKGTTEDGWTIFSNYNYAAGGTTGTPNLANTLEVDVTMSCSTLTVPGNIWIGTGYVVPSPEVKSVVITMDDGYSEWSWVASEAKKRNIPVSFGISKNLIGTAGFLTNAEMRALVDLEPFLFELTNHALQNDSYATLGLSAYMATIEECRDYLLANGADAVQANLHQYVQGSYDATLVAAMQAAGFLCGRTASATSQGTRNIPIALGGSTNYELFQIPATVSLGSSQNLATVQASIGAATGTGAVNSDGTAFIMAHQFGATQDTYKWIKGYSTTYGFLDLLDWLAEQRDTNGWQILRWSDWYRKVLQGKSEILM